MADSDDPAAPDDPGAEPNSGASSGASSGTSTDPTPTRARRGLPVGPVGMLLITMFSLAVAFLVAALVVRMLDDGGPDGDSVDVREVLEDAEGTVVSPGAPVGVGDPAPEVELEYLDGSTAALSSLQGTPVVVNFWSSTCAPCLSEMPDLEAVHAEMGDSVAFLGIDVTDTVEAGRAMVQRTGVTYPNARDPQGRVLGRFGGVALPRTVLIDAEGTIVATHDGALDADELKDLLDDAGVVR
jgi:peroxiredoxin